MSNTRFIEEAFKSHKKSPIVIRESANQIKLSVTSMSPFFGGKRERRKCIPVVDHVFAAEQPK